VREGEDMQRQISVGIFKDPWSAITHFAGFVLASAGALALVWMTLDEPAKRLAMAAYGGSLVLVFLSSSLYHFFDIGESGNRWLRRIDHAAIFGLIAGSYIPPILILLDGPWRFWMLTVVIGLAAVGAVFKMAWIDCPDALGAGLYLALGWVVVIPAHLIFPQLEVSQIAWLVVGGVAYTVGAVVFVKERPDPWPDTFGHHEVWHMFVLAGAGAHFMFTLQLVDVPVPAF
jgi:hemolysin III